MRKIVFIICWALAGAGLYSCSLDEPSYGKTTSENYYRKESDIEQALTGAYLQLRTTWNEYALNHYFVGDCSTDDALKGGGGMTVTVPKYATCPTLLSTQPMAKWAVVGKSCTD